MEHQHEANKENHAEHDMSNMQQGANPSMSMAGHTHHAMMIADFKKRFYVVLALTIPVMFLSEMIQHWLSIHWQFAGLQYVLLTLSTIVFL